MWLNQTIILTENTLESSLIYVFVRQLWKEIGEYMLHADSQEIETTLSARERDGYTVKDKLIIRTTKQAIESQTILSDALWEAESWETAWSAITVL